VVAAVVLLAAAIPAWSQTAGANSTAQERGPQAISPAAISAAIDSLGSLDYPVRTEAARTLRRASPDAAVPALIKAVESHKDQYVRFRALVLLAGFNDKRTPDVVQDVSTNVNDRLRTVAYMYYEHHPSAQMVPALLRALQKEESEFVRPALVRALAAHGTDVRVRETLMREVTRGQDYFRSAVIEALGDYQATYAVTQLIAIAKLNGPLQVDAVIALGKLKDTRAVETLAQLQRSAPRDSQPTIAAAICLIGTNCDSHVPFVIETLKFADDNLGFQELLRNTVTALVELARAGNREALSALFDVGIPSMDPVRARIALGAGTIAIRNPGVTLAFLEQLPEPEGAISLIAEGFDMLEEDYEEEMFFATVRRGYWAAVEGSATRRVGQALIEKLEF